MIDYYEPKLDLTLLGCGFLGGYHIGALYLLHQIWPQKPYNRICGASCGGLIGALALSGIKFDVVIKSSMDILRQLRAFIKNPTQIRGLSVAGLVKQKVEILLPENAHEICSSKLGISLTKLWSMDNKFVSHFETRSDLIDAICAGCFIPVWSGSLVAPKYQGERYIDGAYSDNCPSFGVEASTDANVGRHIELSALMAEVDISPKDKSYMFKGKFMGTVYFASWDNIVRTTHAMLPFRMDTYECYLLNGHSHMKDYLMKNDLIKCRDCWQKASGNDDKAEATVAVVTLKQKTACVACLALLERVDSLTIPDKYRQIFRNYQ